MNDTICALATAPGRAAVAVVRLSGARAGAILESLSHRTRPKARQASVRRLFTTQGKPLDEALVLYFSGPASFTGEDVVELHLHGGRAVVSGVMAALLELGARAAGPGEFTRRAFENGKLSLAEAEGVADLVDAESEAQRLQALGQLSGEMDRRFETWRESLLHGVRFELSRCGWNGRSGMGDSVRREREFTGENAHAGTSAAAACVGRLVGGFAADGDRRPPP